MIATPSQLQPPPAYRPGLEHGLPVTPSEPLGEMVFLRAGAPLYHEEDTATHLYKVVSGAVRAFTFTEDGRRQVNGFHFPGDVFGSARCDHYRYSTEAITDCSLIRYRRQKPSAGAAPTR